MRHQTKVRSARHRDIAEALRGYGCRVLTPPELVAESVRNENYRVLTERGPLFVRFHIPSRSIESLRREHRVIRWPSAQGLPVACPLASQNGNTLEEVNGRL